MLLLPDALLADARDALRLMQQSVWTWVALAVVLVLLAGFVFWIRSWFREDDGPEAEADEMLRLARDLRRQGDLSDEEFRSLKGRLLDRHQRETNAPSTPPDQPIEETASSDELAETVTARPHSTGEHTGDTT